MNIPMLSREEVHQLSSSLLLPLAQTLLLSISSLLRSLHCRSMLRDLVTSIVVVRKLDGRVLRYLFLRFEQTRVSPLRVSFAKGEREREEGSPPTVVQLYFLANSIILVT